MKWRLGLFPKLLLRCWIFYSKNMQEEELFCLSFSHIEINSLTPSLSHSGLASGHLDFYQLFQKDGNLNILKVH